MFAAGLPKFVVLRRLKISARRSKLVAATRKRLETTSTTLSDPQIYSAI